MIKKLVFTLLALGALISVIAAIGWQQMQQAMSTPLNIKEAQLISIKPGDTMHRFSKALVDKKLIENRFWLRNFARLNPKRVALKTGTYQVTPQDNLYSLIDRIAQGKEYQAQITFIEGTTLSEWLVQLRDEPMIEKSDMAIDISAIVDALGLELTQPEGWFFPDTYAFTVGTKDIELLKRAYLRMNETLNEQWQNRAPDLPYQTPYQALIMASIIEKETGLLHEQPRIASVFVNRLRKKMRLQTDPTVIYGLGDRYQGDITRAHLREKTAYNTYRINGLPPTPIAMPGLSAIQAALNPEHSDYLYFVSKGDGSHQFSKTLTEHNRAVRKYQLGKS
ncbi:endolytic transglycosylase MltG [Thalassotalea euphylliae]|uniref:Endolytic murein transglycosylase n=1 Tax=Thalassotalea euphylliae TaxID=1655234 RepID=A0A3E0TYH0_9GAMM|nr:endolytic transglycosylase MltG [Thalassotalea euphylliae]REL29731.1 endolytic transglycosylase MltG [Thalassotalea euphylliae]